MISSGCSQAAQNQNRISLAKPRSYSHVLEGGRKEFCDIPDSYVKKKKEREKKLQGIKNKENNKNQQKKNVFRFIQFSFRKTFTQ